MDGIGQPGVAVSLEPGLRRVLAPNPSAMTGPGTNTYLLGEGDVVVIDPGPDLPAHAQALRAAIGAARVSHVLVTHSHLDHSPLAARLASETGAPVLAFGPSEAGRSAVMQRLVAQGYEGGGEGVDAQFAPDRCLADGKVLETPAGRVEVLHTPGHMGNHLCFGWRGAWFSGDLVMGWTTSLVSPPDGDIADFVASCQRLADRGARVLYPGHGAPVADPAARIDWLVAHRAARRAEVLAALDRGPATVEAITAHVYRDVDESLWPIAARNVFAQLIDLVAADEVGADPGLHVAATFERTQTA
ncbi:MBL fold metallo-hydrolase [Salipiger sp. IMCC34102]|nr:MBL fold metallo-hydrolase [Salipiger sp. IMCC34102]